jgi:hypothetical protein
MGKKDGAEEITWDNFWSKLQNDPFPTITALPSTLQRGLEDLFPDTNRKNGDILESTEIIGEKGSQNSLKESEKTEQNIFLSTLGEINKAVVKFPDTVSKMFSRFNEEDTSANLDNKTVNKSQPTDKATNPEEVIILGNQTDHEPLEPTLTQLAQTPLRQLRQVLGLGRGPEPAVITTAQSQQERIKQKLLAIIAKGAPEPAASPASAASPAPLESPAPTQQKILANKVKNLTAIFLELKYQKIDEILNKSTSAQDKIQEIKKFQGRFNLDLPITDEDKLDRALSNLSRDIEKEGLNEIKVVETHLR